MTKTLTWIIFCVYILQKSDQSYKKKECKTVSDPGESTYQDLSDSLSREGGGFDTGGGGDRPQETVHRAVTHRRQFSDPATQQDLEMASRIGKAIYSQ